LGSFCQFSENYNYKGYSSHINLQVALSLSGDPFSWSEVHLPTQLKNNKRPLSFRPSSEGCNEHAAQAAEGQAEGEEAGEKETQKMSPAN
jgi:hypothetical protein